MQIVFLYSLTPSGLNYSERNLHWQIKSQKVFCSFWKNFETPFKNGKQPLFEGIISGFFSDKQWLELRPLGPFSIGIWVLWILGERFVGDQPLIGIFQSILRAMYDGMYISVLPRIMNFGRIGIPNNIRIFKNDEYEYEYYSEFEKLFEYYSWEIFK